MSKQIYRYTWANNVKRRTMWNRQCRVLGRLKKNSVIIQFIDNGQKEIVSRHALRKANK